jgi:simple sugar transport system permease protein
MTSEQLVALLAAAVTAGTPLVLAGVGELLAERSGVLNLGVEGVMLVGAVAGFAVVVTTTLPWLGAAAAAGAGALLGAGHAFLTVTLGAEQVTTGLALALFGTGLSAFVGKPLIGMPNPAPFRAVALPGLADVPGLGRIFFRQDALVYLSYALPLAAWWWLTRTRPGLHLRACGENPEAADAMGVDVAAMRYGAVIAGAALAGLAGGYLSLAYTPAWTENMTGGLGWIAIALVIFATWNPVRVLAGAYLFGAVDVLGFRAQLLGVQTSSIVLRMLPYLFTLAVLLVITLLRRTAGMPAALGRPYVREE